ncbi:MAG: hypothetical protein ACXW3R_00870 [Rhodoplanes sp.]
MNLGAHRHGVVVIDPVVEAAAPAEAAMETPVELMGLRLSGAGNQAAGENDRGQRGACKLRFAQHGILR